MAATRTLGEASASASSTASAWATAMAAALGPLQRLNNNRSGAHYPHQTDRVMPRWPWPFCAFAQAELISIYI